MEQRRNASLNRAGSKVILVFLMLGLVAFTATRTLHFLLMTMPHGQEYVAYLGLVAFDIGALGWLYYAMNAAEGVNQRTLSYGMVFVCTAGVIITMVTDMLMVSAQNGLTNKIPTDLATVALWVVIVIFSLNVVAAILVHLLNPSHQRHMVAENAKDRIHIAVLAAIDQEAIQVAPEVARIAASYWRNQVLADLTGYIPGVDASNKNLTVPVQLPQAKIVEADMSNKNLTSDLSQQRESASESAANQQEQPTPKKKVRKLPKQDESTLTS